MDDGAVGPYPEIVGKLNPWKCFPCAIVTELCSGTDLTEATLGHIRIEPSEETGLQRRHLARGRYACPLAQRRFCAPSSHR